MEKITAVNKIDNRLSDTKVLVTSDIINPLCGPKGASKIYGPQKGATPEVIEELDESISHKVSLIKNSIKQSMRAIKTGRELKKN